MILSGAKPVPGWPGYLVTKNGDVFSCKKQGLGADRSDYRRLKPNLSDHHKSAWQIGLSNNGKKERLNVGALVWMAFMGPIPPGKTVDHINGDCADHRLENLRLATPSEQMRNQRKRKVGSSMFKGVYWDKQAKKWRAHIKTKDKKVNLGRFTSEIEAAAAYNAAALAIDPVFYVVNEDIPDRLVGKYAVIGKHWQVLNPAAQNFIFNTGLIT